ncbi:hypothetical protein [Mucisphaera sp.]|uniref:hypothetical protein n=1 Tax=Mucisphaera sp. TaxID=2913024 RepID=UPI003D14B461
MVVRTHASSEPAVYEDGVFPPAPGELDSQINVAPEAEGRLWLVIAAALRCPKCGSVQHKAETGRRASREGLCEQYRRCGGCGIRFRTILE